MTNPCTICETGNQSVRRYHLPTIDEEGRVITVPMSASSYGKLNSLIERFRFNKRITIHRRGKKHVYTKNTKPTRIFGSSYESR